MNIIIFTDNQKYNMHCKEYEIIWEKEGKRILNSFKKIIGLPFLENEIRLLINEGYNNSNFAGDKISDIMNFRFNNRCKIGTFLHELSHRIVLEYNMFEKTKALYGFKNIHELIDLFLYDIIVDLYGKEAADLRVEYESNFEEEEYKNAWIYSLSKSYEKRKEILKNIKECLKSE